MSGSPPIHLREIARFWAPMALTWLMMSLEGPFLAAVIARLDDPKHNLAAFGVAFAFAIIIEAPVIMMLSAATTLVTGDGSYRRLLNFTSMLNAAITVGMLALLLSPLFDGITRGLIRLDEPLAAMTRHALLVMLPWPAAIGYRRFFQGLLIREGRTRLIAYGTVTRLVTMAGTGAVLGSQTDLPGAIVGCAALSAGVSLEAVVTRIMAQPVVRIVRAAIDAKPREAARTYRGIAVFYYPLALMSTISLATQPVITFFMGQARFPLESLAVLPVVNSLSFIFRAVGLSFQEVSIALLDRGTQNWVPVRRFALLLAFASSGGLALIAFTPLADVWFHDISGLSEELTAFARTPTRIAALVPFVSVLLAFQRSVLVHGHRTPPITWASAAEISATAAVLALAIFGLDLVGAIAASSAMVAGRVAGNLTLLGPSRSVVKTMATTTTMTTTTGMAPETKTRS